MKKLFFFIAGISLLFACSKDEAPTLSDDNPQNETLACGKVFMVQPTKGSDITYQLKQTFADAIAAGPGSVVQLPEGDFELGFIEIHNFFGKFKGAGKDKTVITALEGLDIGPLVSLNLNTFLIKFVGGDVYMCDMTVRTPPGVLTTDPNEWWIEGLVSFSAKNREYASPDDYIRAVVNNIDFIAGNEPVSGWKSNCNQGLMAGFDSRYTTIPGGWPLSPTDITITNCSFENFDIYGALIAYTNGGKIIAGNKNNGNTFINNSTSAYGYGGSLAFWHNTNMEVAAISNNFIDPAGARFGIEATSAPWPDYLQQVPQTKATVFNIEQNIFNITGGIGGVLVNDQRRVIYSDALPMLVQVKNNKFNMSDGAFTGMGCFNNAGMVIRNNKFIGSGSFGVRVMRGPSSVFNENGLMLGNNFSSTIYSVTTVLLNNGSRNWTIVGGNLGERVNNLGDNNLITGFNVNSFEGEFGQTIVDNLGEMREAIKTLKGH